MTDEDRIKLAISKPQWPREFAFISDRRSAVWMACDQSGSALGYFFARHAASWWIYADDTYIEASRLLAKTGLAAARFKTLREARSALELALQG